MFNINLPFLKSTLSKTYYKLSHSILICLNINSDQNIMEFFSLVDMIVDEGMLNKVSVIAFSAPKNTDKRNSQSTASSDKKNIELLQKEDCKDERAEESQVHNKFIIFCKKYKIIVMYVSHHKEISTDNEIFRNLIGYLLLKKFSNTETRVNNKHNNSNSSFNNPKRDRKRNSVTLVQGELTFNPENVSKNLTLNKFSGNQEVDLKKLRSVNPKLFKRKHSEK